MSGQPVGTMSEMVRIIEKQSNSEICEFHRFVLPDGSLGASKVPDPKYLIIDGVYFGRFTGTDPIKREPEYLFPHFPAAIPRKLYGAFRKLCCMILGPEEDGILAADMTPFLRSVFFFWDSRRS